MLALWLLAVKHGRAIDTPLLGRLRPLAHPYEQRMLLKETSPLFAPNGVLNIRGRLSLCSPLCHKTLTLSLQIPMLRSVILCPPCDILEIIEF